MKRIKVHPPEKWEPLFQDFVKKMIGFDQWMKNNADKFKENQRAMNNQKLYDTHK